MIKQVIIFSTLLVSASVYCQSGAQSVSPVDKMLKDCLEADSSQTTAGMIDCINNATIEWDNELNKNYKLLISVLDPLEKEKLKASQLKWIEFKDKELEFSGALHDKLEGTMWLVVRANRKLEIIKQRAIELKDYYDLINNYY